MTASGNTAAGGRAGGRRFATLTPPAGAAASPGGHDGVTSRFVTADVSAAFVSRLVGLALPERTGV